MSFISLHKQNNKEMQNQTKYKFIIMALFHEYITNENLELLINKLREIEAKVETEIWFRFFEDDTLATTVNDIERDLSLHGRHANHKFMVENLERGILLESNFKVFYS